jgi:hypothetical protein
MINQGPGPALVKSVKYFVDRKQLRDLDEASSIGKLDPDQMDYFEFESGDVMAVGEKEWLVRHRKRRGKSSKASDADRFADFIDDRLAIEVTFCSVVDEDTCWTKWGHDIERAG